MSREDIINKTVLSACKQRLKQDRNEVRVAIEQDLTSVMGDATGERLNTVLELLTEDCVVSKFIAEGYMNIHNSHLEVCKVIQQAIWKVDDILNNPMQPIDQSLRKLVYTLHDAQNIVSDSIWKEHCVSEDKLKKGNRVEITIEE